MCKKIVTLLLCLQVALLVLGSSRVEAWTWPWENKNTAKVLVKINDKTYTTADFKHWWNNWRDPNTAFPKTLDPFINWFLLVQEAQRMELYRDPEYRHKVLVFLKVRSLLSLKYYAVDSKIHITDDQIKKEYLTRYCPLWDIAIAFFKDKKDAQQAYKELLSGKLKFSSLAEKSKKVGLEFEYKEGWVRPISCPKKWKKVVERLKVGEIGTPIPMGNGFIIIKLLQKRGPSDKDFKALKSRIKFELRRHQEDLLTNKLINKLKKKYKVKVDWKLLEVINLGKMPPNILNATLVSTARGRVTVKTFLELMKKEISYRESLHLGKEGLEHMKLRILNDMLGQTLTMWYALDQHYERRPPLKWIYRFYCQNRLIKELEYKVLYPKVKITQQDIKTFYKSHIKHYTLPESVSIAVLMPETEKLANKIWNKICTGEDFFEVAKEFYPHGVKVRTFPIDHLVPKMRKLVSSLAIGEVSKPVYIRNHWMIVKLIKVIPPHPIPLEKVKDQIYQKLWENKFKEIKNNYIKLLRSKSTIIIYPKVWKELVSEMGSKHEKNKKAAG